MEFKSLKALKNVSVLNTQAFLKIEDELLKLKNLQCIEFKVDLLQEKVICPFCEYPKDFPMVDIDHKTKEIEDSTSNILHEWEANLLHEVHNYRDNITYLTAEEQALIQEIVKNSALPEEVTDDLIKALNNIFKELEVVEVTPQQLLSELFTDARVLDYATLTERLDSFKQSLFAGRDLDKVRIKLIKGDQ